VRPGSFAEYTRTSATCCIKKPAGITFEAAALTEPLSGAWKGVIQYSQLTVGEDVVVIGVGGIGLLCLMVAKAAGAGRLIAVDGSDFALANAKRLGATHTVNPKAGDVKEQVYAIAPDGPDLVIEAAGPIAAVELARDLRRRGTRWNIFGITTHEKFELDGGLTHFLEGRMDASFGTTPHAMLSALRLMERGLVDPSAIISHRFTLDHIHDAVAAMGQPERNKVMILP
jgi:threonine dehydrogenase-like Zn-dependent dehydrogenase